MTRFSPVSGTTSATVAIATSFKNDSSSRSRRAGSNPKPRAALHQLQRDARAAQIFLRIGAIATVGIEHGERGRQFGFGQMMIGDDDVDPKR